MVERRTNVSQFAGVNALQKRIEELTKERDELTKARQDSQTRLLEDHGISLAGLEKSVALLVERTKDLSTLGDRVTGLEKWKILMAGYASAFGIIGAGIGYLVTLIVQAWHR